MQKLDMYQQQQQKKKGVIDRVSTVALAGGVKNKGVTFNKLGVKWDLFSYENLYLGQHFLSPEELKMCRFNHKNIRNFNPGFLNRVVSS